MIYGGLTAKEVIAVHREMELPEPFLFPWRNAETGAIEGMVTGRISGPVRHLDVDHMIVLPRCTRKLVVMMAMSEAATQAAFRDGCEYITVSIFRNDPRASGLRAWAKRMRYQFWQSGEDADWYVRQLVHERTPSNGQGCQAARSEAAPAAAGPER